jgi:hypothetical protein
MRIKVMLMLWKIVPVFTIGETLEGDYTKDITQGDEACYVCSKSGIALETKNGMLILHASNI